MPAPFRRCPVLPLFLAAALFALGGCIKEVHQTLEFRADGSVVYGSDATLDRSFIESTVAWQSTGMDREEQLGMYLNLEDPSYVDRWAEGVTPPADAAVAEEEPVEEGEEAGADGMTDDELADAVRRTTLDRTLLANMEGVTLEIPTVEVREDTVRVVSRATFRDLTAAATYLPHLSQGSPLNHLRLQRDDEDRLRVTFAAEAEERIGQQIPQMRAMIRQNRFKGSVSIVMPGPIVESNLPEIEGHRAAVTIDGSDEASIEALVELLKSGVTVAAEPGELDLASLPLDSRELSSRIVWRDQENAVDESEIVDAAESYVAEPLSVSVLRVHRYPAARDYAQLLEATSWEDQEGADISVRLHAPEGRMLLQAGTVRVEKAVDEQGRDLAKRGAGETYTTFGEDDESDHRSLDFEIPLGVPAADAEAIEEVTGTVVVQTFDAWREHRFEDVRANPGVGVPLNDLAEGVEFRIERVRMKEEQHSSEGVIHLVLTGPPAVRDLRFDVDLPGFENVWAHTMHDETTTEDGQSRRTLVLNWNGHRFDEEGAAASRPPNLVVRFPEGLRHERVPFAIDAIDLY